MGKCFPPAKTLRLWRWAVGAGAGVTFLLKYAGWSGTYLLFAFQILIIPLIANIADHRKFVVWQICILSSVVCTLGMIWRVDPPPKLELVYGVRILGNGHNSFLAGTRVLVLASIRQVPTDYSVHPGRSWRARAVRSGQINNPVAAGCQPSIGLVH